MVPNLKVLALSRQAEEICASFKQLISEKTGLKADSIDFSLYDDLAQLVKGLKTAFASSSDVMVCADLGYFLRFKSDIFKVMGLKAEESKSIESAIEILAPETPPDLMKAHSQVAQGARVFLTDDGLFSSFALESGQDRLIVAPCDLKRLEASLELGLSAYIERSEPALPAFDFTPLNSLIWAQGLKIAVANSKNSLFLKLRLKESQKSDLDFTYLDVGDEEDKSEPKLLTANRAKSVRELGKADIGLAISDIYTSKNDGSKSYAFVALANADGAKVVKVHAKPGESPRLLVRAAVDTLLVELTASSGLGKGMLKNPQEENDGKKRAFKISLSAIIALVLTLIIILVGSKITNAAKEYFDKISNTQSTQTDTHIYESETEEDTDGEISLDSSDETDSSDLADSSLTDESFLSSILTTIVNTSLAGIIATFPSYPTSTTQRETSTSKTTASAATTSTTKINTTTTTKQTTTVSTTKSTTAKTTTTTAATTTAGTSPSLSGSFTFTTKGYGHGVGFSQEGAKTMANQGKTYIQILEHYFPGSKVIDDPNGWPEYITYGGKEYTTEEYLIRTTVQEIGASSPLESLKAQAVAAYNFAKIRKFNVSADQSAFNYKFDIDKDSNAKRAVQAVRNKYLDYNGQTVSAYYFASSAGKTVSSSSVWGGTSPSYLMGGVSSPETVDKRTATFTVDQIRSFVDDYNNKYPNKKISLSNNPNDWIEITKTDSAGYVEEMRIGDRTMNGNHFRFYVMQLKIRSHCFTYTYTN